MSNSSIKFQGGKFVCDKFGLYQIEPDYYAVCSSSVVNFLKLNYLTPFMYTLYDNCEITDQFDTHCILMKNVKYWCCLGFWKEYSHIMRTDGFCHTYRIDWLEKNFVTDLNKIDISMIVFEEKCSCSLRN